MNMVFKPYTSKSNANRAAAKVGQQPVQEDGKWGIMVPAEVTLAEAQAEAQLDEVVLSGTVIEVPNVVGVQESEEATVADNEAAYADLRRGNRNWLCPGCGIHLSNGVGFDEAEHPHESNEIMCLGCGHEFGPATLRRGTAPVLSDLPLEQHGVKRPQRQGLCWQVWELAYQLQEGNGVLPTVAQVRAAAPHLNPTNVQIEFYNWRKYNGIRGRQ